MRIRSLTLAAALLAGSTVFPAPALAPAAHAGPAASCPWVGSSAPVDQRVAQVMAQITQAEEVDLVHGVSGTYVGNVPANTRLCIPALSRGPAR